MKRYLIPLLLCGLASSATNEQPLNKEAMFQRDNKRILAEIDAMVRADQDIRHYLSYGTTAQAAIDSTDQALADSNRDIDSFPKAAQHSGPHAGAT